MRSAVLCFRRKHERDGQVNRRAFITLISASAVARPLETADTTLRWQTPASAADTLRNMLLRLDGYVPPGTRLVIVQGGYNDVMIGSSSAAMSASIEGILARLAARRINTVLCGFFDRGWDAAGPCDRQETWRHIRGRQCVLRSSVPKLGQAAHDRCGASGRRGTPPPAHRSRLAHTTATASVR
jgi:hypothetical protein